MAEIITGETPSIGSGEIGIPSKKAPAESFAPDEPAARRTLLNQSLSESQRRWFALDLERLSREMTLKMARDGKLRATTIKKEATDDATNLVTGRLAQIAFEQEQLENEIRVYRDAIAKLPKE